MILAPRIALGSIALGIAIAALSLSATAVAHKLHEKAVAVMVANSPVTVTPSREWNQLGTRIGKNTETWTIDGEQLNDVTFFAGIEAGKPLMKERSKKRDPLPKFTKDMLLIEVPELLEGTYRTQKGIGTFQLLSTESATFLGREGIRFSYEYADVDELTRKGEARATVIGGKLYMIAFDAPRLSYYAKSIVDFRSLADTAIMQ